MENAIKFYTYARAEDQCTQRAVSQRPWCCDVH